MSYACCPFSNSAGDDDDDDDDDGVGDGQCGNVGIGFCLLQFCKREEKIMNILSEERACCGSGWASQVSACLPA